MVDKKSKESPAGVGISTKKPLCFVIGPIGKLGTPTRDRADFLLEGVIRHVLETDEFVYQVRRADEDARAGMISDRVLHDVREAELVIADLTDLNANAFYELAIRHLTEKPTIHMTNDITSLPFDNIGHAAISVDLTTWHGILAARSSLAASVRATQADDFKISNPITQANALFKPKGSADLPSDILIELRERVNQLERLISSTDSFCGSNFARPVPFNRGRINERILRDLGTAVIAGAPSNDSAAVSIVSKFIALELGLSTRTITGTGDELSFVTQDGPEIRMTIVKYPPSPGDITVQVVG